MVATPCVDGTQTVRDLEYRFKGSKSMRESFPVKTTLLSSFWILFLLALLLPSWFYYRNIIRAVTAEAENSVVERVQLVSWLMAQETELRDVEHFQKWLEALGNQMGARITYVAENGRVVADSEFPLTALADLDNFSTRPEIAEARSAGVGVIIRYSRVVKKEFIYAAKNVPKTNWIPSGFVRIAVPFSTVKDVLDHLKGTFLVFIFIIFTVTAFLSYRLICRFRSPLGILMDAVRAIRELDFKRRVRFTPDQELYPLAQSINRMAEALDTRLHGISEEKQRLEAVFDGMQEGVMVLDSRGKILTINRALSQVVENPPSPLGKRPLELIMNLELQEVCDRVLSSRSSLESRQDKLQIELAHGRIYEITVVNFEDHQRGMGAILVFHDISELKRLERVRQDFVANVSHELRTPLTSIKTCAEDLAANMEQDLGTSASVLQTILRNTDHMVRMVDDLLHLARLDAGRISFKPRTVNALNALMTAWSECRVPADGKWMEIRTEFPESLPDVSADFDQLVLVFRNLLENAVRHSPPGGCLTVGYAREGEVAQFSIRDDGPGIPRHYQHRVFERFFRVEGHRGNDMETGGTGLGLAICRHIIENHGGRIWVQSPNPGAMSGSTFFFTLPVASADAGALQN
jgi:two-component system phosphate regulon sensor histidine kinase PhoR